MTKLPTGHGLLIAEKSSFKKTVEAVYRKYATELPFTLDFECFAGHVVEMEKPAEVNAEWAEWKMDNLPMIPPQWRYRKSTIENKAKRYDAVLARISGGRYDFIINAGDPEREGQLIQDAFFSTMSSNLQTIPVYRMWFNDEKDETLVKSLKNLLAPDDNIPNAGTVRHLSEASFLRARLDWLLGLNSTQALSLKSHAKVPVGRVKTPILKILVDRELTIRNFVVKPFWTVRVIFEHPNGAYMGTLMGEDGKPVQFFDKSEAEAAAAKLDPSASGTVTDKKVTRSKEQPPRFYSLSKLQGDAARIFGIPMPESLSTLQWLYEKQILSYPRTDSQFITEAMTPDMPAIFKSAQEAPRLAKFPMPSPAEFAAFAKNKNHVNDAEARAHTALMPLTNVILDFDKMTETQQNVFYLVARSVILPFLGPIEKEKTELVTEFCGHLFKTTGSVITREGWMAATPEYNSRDQVLPAIDKGDSVSMDKHEMKEGKTTPPKRYTVDSLMSVLENIHTLLETDEAKLAMKKAEGLGRPSTRTAILEALQKDQMITCSGKKQEFAATEFGIDVIQKLGNTPLTSPQLTATWETRLQELEDGKLAAADLYQKMVDYTRHTISELKKIDFTIEHAPVDKAHEPVGALPNGNKVMEAKAGFYDSAFIAWREACAQAEADGSAKPDFSGFWVGKTWDNASMKMTGSFSRKDMTKLLAGEIIEKEFTWKQHGSKSKAKLRIGESNRIEFVKSNSTQEKESLTLGLYQVEHIRGKREDGTSYDIYKFADPEFICSGVIGGYVITHDDMARLVNGEMLERTLKSKAGKDFQANLTLVIGQGINMEPVRNSGERVSDNITRHEKDGRIYYRLSNGVVVGSTIAGHTMTIPELEQLAAGHYVYAEDFVSKKGSNFSARLVVEGKEVKFAFD